MNSPMPHLPPSTPAQSVNEESLAIAILAVVRSAKAEGKSLAALEAEILADDALLDARTRQSLSDIVSEAWDQLA
jgi:hypothetical protein